MSNGNTAKKISPEDQEKDYKAVQALLGVQDPHYLSAEAVAIKARKDFEDNFLRTLLTAEHLLIDENHPQVLRIGNFLDDVNHELLEDLRLQFQQWEAMPDSPTKLEMFLHLDEFREALNNLMAEGVTERAGNTFDALDIDLDELV